MRGLPNPRHPRRHNQKHLRLIRQLPCIVCFRAAPSEAAHIRYGEPDRGKPMTGVAERPDDKWTLPLCAQHHRTGPDAQHSSGEREWWERHGIDPLPICEALYLCPTIERMEEVYFTLCFGKKTIW